MWLWGSGNKKDNITVIYTPFPNLKAGPHPIASPRADLCFRRKQAIWPLDKFLSIPTRKSSEVSLDSAPADPDRSTLTCIDKVEVHVVARENAVVNRLNKTKLEKEVDHEAERQARLKDEGRRKKAEATERVSRKSPFNTARHGQLILPEGSGRG